jgi:hypothetical protein
VVNKNTALQSLKTHLVVVRIVGCCEVLWRARRETTLTLLMDLSGKECNPLPLCSGARYARTYIFSYSSKTSKPHSNRTNHQSQQYSLSIKSLKSSIRTQWTQCLSGKLKIRHPNQLNHQSQQSSFSILLQKPPSGLSVLSASVVNYNTAS